MDALISTSKNPTIYAFCDYKEEMSLNAGEILGSLTKQLLSGRGRIPEDIEKRILDVYQAGTITPEPVQVLEILVETARLCGETVSIILDGVDECKGDDRKEILSAMRSLTALQAGAGGTIFKLFIASRADVDIERALKGSTPLSLNSSNLTKDIEFFVQEAIRARVESGELVVSDPEVLHEIITVLTEKADGM